MAVDNATLLDQETPAALPATTVALDPQMQMLRELAADPNFDVAKLQAMVAMIERAQDRGNEQQFNAAFARMQPHIPTINEKGRTDKGTYAPREDIVDAVRPILAEYGFSASFRTEWPENGKIRIVGILTHEGGHSRESTFEAAADTSGSKNAVQAQGSTVEYGRRYTLSDLLNIVTRRADDDGRKSDVAKAPDGYADWIDDMEAMVAGDCDTAALQNAWNASKDDFRKWAAKHERTRVETWKKKAKAVTHA